MGRDMAKKNIADYRWTKENTTRVTIKIRNDSGIPDAIEKMQENGYTKNSYIIQALTEKLIRDGYLQEQQPEEN